ncbi:SDR family oxidoreductase [Streptomyces griseus]|uniref:SDR family oxidoreductase n=1 Tax=Streptomyces griseus TaxID=1911 RepID=UPI0013B6BEDD|nr:SDR family oxidoreductase [Streptomyces griseus]
MIDPGLSQKTILVTGGATNIGAAISRAFAEQGARVVVHYPPGEASAGPHGHTASDARAFVSSLPGAMGIAEDFLTPGAAGRLMETLEKRVGAVDVLINNASLANEADTFGSLDDTGMEQTLRVNTMAPALLIAELSRRLPENAPPGSASVVNISTDAARGFPGQVSYGMSKAALESLTRGAAVDLGPRIRVNAVAPGPIQTGWMDDRLISQVIPGIPLKRVGDPTDIADACVFLASHQARWITGQVIQVAGGHWL